MIHVDHLRVSLPGNYLAQSALLIGEIKRQLKAIHLIKTHKLDQLVLSPIVIELDETIEEIARHVVQQVKLTIA